MRGSRSRRPIFAALLVAAAAAFAAYWAVGRQEEAAPPTPAAVVAAPTAPPRTAVLIALRDIGASTVLTADMVGVKQVLVDDKNERALTEPEQAIGRTTGVALMRGEQVLSSRLQTEAPAPETYAREVPVGKRALSLVFDEVRGIGGLVQPGDHVDVIAYFELEVDDLTIEEKESSADRRREDGEGDEDGEDGEDADEADEADNDDDGETAEYDYKQYASVYIVQDVEVLAVSQAMTPDEVGIQDRTTLPEPPAAEGVDPAPTPDPGDPQTRPDAKSVTLAVTPEQAPRLLLAAQTVYDKTRERDAGLRLAVRAPGDTTIVDLPPAQLGGIPLGGLLGNVDQQITPNELVITDAAFTRRELNSGEVLEFRATVKNISDRPVRSGRDAPPEYTYTQGLAYDALGFAPQDGTYRLGLNVEGAFPTQYPYRWGLGRDLNPGESIEVVGAVQLTEPTPRTGYWLGVIQEPNVVTQDGVAVADVTVFASETVAVLDPSTPLRASPNAAGEVLLEVGQGDELVVLEARGAWFRVRVGEADGWVAAPAVTAAPVPQPGTAPSSAGGADGTYWDRIRARMNPWHEGDDE